MLLSKKLVYINGEAYKYKASFTVLSLLTYLSFNTGLIVIDYNGTILPTELWPKTVLVENDRIEILTVAGGG